MLTERAIVRCGRRQWSLRAPQQHQHRLKRMMQRTRWERLCPRLHRRPDRPPSQPLLCRHHLHHPQQHSSSNSNNIMLRPSQRLCRTSRASSPVRLGQSLSPPVRARLRRRSWGSAMARGEEEEVMMLMAARGMLMMRTRLTNTPACMTRTEIHCRAHHRRRIAQQQTALRNAQRGVHVTVPLLSAAHETRGATTNAKRAH